MDLEYKKSENLTIEIFRKKSSIDVFIRKETIPHQ